MQVDNDLGQEEGLKLTSAIRIASRHPASSVYCASSELFRLSDVFSF